YLSVSKFTHKFTDREILDRVASLPSFCGWPVGPLDVWIRSRADEYDRFDDKAFTYECFGDERPPRFLMSRTGTTNAGSYGLKHFDDYGQKGCAVLKSDVIVYGSHVYGLHHGKPGYIQRLPFPYYRDADRDKRAEESGREYNDVIGANIHRAGV